MRKIRIAKLLRVAARNGRHNIGQGDGRLHKVYGTVKAHRLSEALRQSERMVKERSVRPALILYVVDGEHGLCLWRPVGVERAVVGNGSRRLPIVTV